MRSVIDTQEFLALFSPAKDFYGVTVVGDIVDGKAQSTSQCLHEPLMPSVVERHLNGEVSIGASPLKGDDTIEFGAIDIDNYDGNLIDIISAIYEFELPICPCYSKSKKLHLYFFFTTDTSAEDGVSIMRWYARAFGLSKKVEIFPKQVKRTPNNRAYSWINLPYFNEADESNHRKMVGSNGELRSLSAFIDRAARCKMSFEQHQQMIKGIKYYDAPPCILTSILLNDIGQGGRNNFLFSVGAYWKLKEEDSEEDIDFEQELFDLNERLPDPLPERELKQTVISSLEKKSYFYICSAMSHCDKQNCMKLDLGVGSNKSTGLTYGTFKQYLSDPPYYTWDINGREMTFYSESEILGQSKFREQCMRELHLLPRKIDDNKWTAVVNKALQNIEVVEVDNKGGDFTKGSQFYALVCEFFQDRRRADNIAQTRMGRVFYDSDRGAFAFMAGAFMSFIRDAKSFRQLSDMEMREHLTGYGAYTIGSIWYLPVEALEGIEKPEEVKQDDAEIDFNNHQGESDDF